ncbi:MAG: DUF4266 domain-containing protein [Methyloprofundus sp.]|nr:DUF4266 domain-containing protein [Methyloprofundus sp.]
MIIKKTSLILMLLFSSSALIGCSSVAPWERGILAKPQMALDPHPLQSIQRAHHYSSREAGAASNASSGGGGCGCY